MSPTAATLAQSPRVAKRRRGSEKVKERSRRRRDQSRGQKRRRSNEGRISSFGEAWVEVLSEGSSHVFPIEVPDDISIIEDDNDNNNTDNLPETPLSRLVDEDSGDDGITMTADQQRVMVHMVKMRNNLERFVHQELSFIDRTSIRGPRESLNRSISALQGSGLYNKQFVAAMHKLRNYGNAAVHARIKDLPTYEQCTLAVREYLQLKQEHKNNKLAK